jgi:threonine dehydrogenase-like Zn-dependent dehydrogenase
VRLASGHGQVQRLVGEFQGARVGVVEVFEVLDLTLPLEQAPEGYKAMDERRATKVILTF